MLQFNAKDIGQTKRIGVALKDEIALRDEIKMDARTVGDSCDFLARSSEVTKKNNRW